MIARLCRLLIHLFFARVEVLHAERFPGEGAVLVVSNHHSGLIDPMLLIAALPRPPRFLAKAALWRPRYLLLRPLLNAARAIPVHRQVDGGGDNRGMFEASRRALGEGSVIALFGEGVSHDQPGLLELKTGAARLALGGSAAVHVLPVGIVYADRATYRSTATVAIGEPVLVRGRHGGDEDRAAVRTLTAQIEDGLSSVAPTWEDHETMAAARLAAAAVDGSGEAAVLHRLERALAAGASPSLFERIEALQDDCLRLGVDPRVLVESTETGHGRRARLGLRNALAVVGRLLNLPAFLVVRLLSRSHDLNFQATSKLLAGVAVYPIWWLILGVAGWRVVGPGIGVALAALAPVLGYHSARRYGRIRRSRRARDLHRLLGGAGGIDSTSLVGQVEGIRRSTLALLNASQPGRAID